MTEHLADRTHRSARLTASLALTLLGAGLLAACGQGVGAAGAGSAGTPTAVVTPNGAATATSPANANPPKTIRVDLGSLTTGPAPTIAYLVTVDQRTRLVSPSGFTAERDKAIIVPVGPQGALALLDNEGSGFGPLVAIGQTPWAGASTISTAATIPVVDAAGRVAFWRSTAKGGVFEQRSGSTGASLASVATEATATGVVYEAKAQLGDGVVLADRLSESGGEGWGKSEGVRVTADGRLTELAGMSSVLAASEASGLYAGTTATGATAAASAATASTRTKPHCSEVRRAADDRTVWSSCHLIPMTFSADGRYLAALPKDFDGVRASQVTVIDTATWRPVLIVASVVGSVGFEPGGALLTAVAADTPGASGIVRCTVSGACELAQTVDRGRAAGYAIRAS